MLWFILTDARGVATRYLGVEGATAIVDWGEEVNDEVLLTDVEKESVRSCADSTSHVADKSSLGCTLLPSMAARPPRLLVVVYLSRPPWCRKS